MGLFRFGSRRKAFRELRSPKELREATGNAWWVLFKHSPFCAVSSIAYRRMARLAERRNDIPVYLIDVVRDRDVSEQAEALLNIRHQSPQVIVLARSTPQWDASHGAVTEDGVQQALPPTPAA